MYVRLQVAIVAILSQFQQDVTQSVISRLGGGGGVGKSFESSESEKEPPAGVGGGGAINV